MPTIRPPRTRFGRAVAVVAVLYAVWLGLVIYNGVNRTTRTVARAYGIDSTRSTPASAGEIVARALVGLAVAGVVILIAWIVWHGREDAR